MADKLQEETEALPWIEKYRPQKLDDLVAHDEIVATIRKLVDANRLPHLLFYGPPGTGKTSTILAVAREMYGSSMRSMVLEMNASDARGIDTVRNEISNFAGTRKLFSTGIKLVILDEADNMTKDAQMALRRVIEKYASNARFCIICNYASKIIPALQSRCTRFRFAPLKTQLVVGRVKEIIAKEELEVSEAGLDAVLKLGEGDMRKVLNILQSSSLANNRKVDEAAVYRCTGKPTAADILACRSALFSESVSEAFQTMRNLQVTKGLALVDILQALHEDLKAVKFAPSTRVQLLKHMAEIEYNLASGTSETLQLGALVGAFFISRRQMQDGVAAAAAGSSSSASSSAMEISNAA
ncbi:Replication factor C subunit 5 [Hondaea fermentalgiana]|uniref:Replication factor C subunit 5 n=1 Tax=Hondaea fermentalgiana TaxID=2315210 RepID=A0A2R5GU05_9STRA|nr:Replication factor C subunit 5 [Hondaea fermentalgiana]|eukprot:GBG31871.1 Replication factor C subunit 5 [Hondaea fermentalgiana]